MNKGAIIITVVAAYFVAVSQGVPAPRVVNWVEVAGKVGEIQAAVVGSTSEIKTIAENDNEQVGSTIGSKVDTFVDSARVILERVNAAIATESLTVEQARADVSLLKGDIGRLIGSLQDDIALLNPIAARQIRQIFSATFDTIDLRATELYVLLQQ